jgi:hypothetical protein
MKYFLSLLFVFHFAIVTIAQQNRPGGGRGAPSAAGRPLSSGQLPDMDAYTAEGELVKVRELVDGKYAVLSAGCLTCPQFHQGYPEVEALAADYAPKGVHFFYFYKSLRHPELNGYVQAQNMEERFLQLKEAREKLGTKVPWIADTLDDSMRIGLNSGPNSLYLISPDGEIITASDRIEGNNFRQVLNKLVGPVESPTSLGDMDLPRVARQRNNINEDSDLGVHRPEGLTIVSITPLKPEETYYVKLRAEADRNLLRTGTGRLFLGFYPDPIHDAHWNNLVDPMKYVLKLPEGVSATPVEATAEKGRGDTDTRPRQFWVDIDGASPSDELQLALHYYGCTPDMCVAMTHEYTIRLENENRGSRTFGMNRGPGGGGERAGPRGGQRGGQFGGPRGPGGGPGGGGGHQPQGRGPGGGIAQMDANQDGEITLAEVTEGERQRRGDAFSEERVQRMFDFFDEDQDGIIYREESQKAPPGRGPRN